MDANNQRPGFIKVYRLWRGLADMGTYLNESLLSGKYGHIYAEDAKQLRKEALPKGVYPGLCLTNVPKQPGSKPNSQDGQPRFNFKQLHMGPGFVEKTYILELINDLLHAFECLGEK